jgi:hypothetical protein
LNREEHNRSRGVFVNISEKGWHRTVADPIPLPDGGQLITLHDAATFITKLPKHEHDAEEWQAAMEARRCSSPNMTGHRCSLASASCER